jgi:hypothetical protein
MKARPRKNVDSIVHAALVTLWLTTAAGAAQFVFENLDGPGEGLNDATPAAPVGGNPATTLGGQRLAALERVGEIWGSFLVSSVPIRATVNFDQLGAGVLAAAGPEDIEENFANAPQPNTWAPVALANALAGVDLEPGAPDIGITANSDGRFYYGFDSATPAGKSNFVDVLLHELGHGLGFISFADPANGNLLFGQSDVFSNHIYDNTRKKAWPALTAAQRVDSAKSDPKLLWDGPFTTAGAPFVLALSPGPGGFALTAELPPRREIAFIKTAFGPAIPPAGIAGALAVARDGTMPPGDPTGACQTLVNASEVAGNVAMVRRGLCNFDDKVFRAQQAGAVAVIIADNVDENLVNASGDGVVDGVAQTFTIPAIFISKADGDALQAASPGVTVTLAPLPPQRAGTMAGRLRLYAPPALSEGSSVSHWTPDASPNLVMEPFINPALYRKLDLGLTAMKDIGWQTIDIPFPHLTFELWQTGAFPAVASATAAGDDPDGDGMSNFEEYFFGSDPLAGDRRRLPTIVLANDGRRLSFTRSALPADLSYRLEKSENLADFAPATAGVDYIIETSPIPGADAERVTLRLTGSPAPLKMFFRLRIDRTVSP